MKYPFTPEILDAMPEELAELYRGLELTLISRICQQLTTGKINETTIQNIRILRSHGISLNDIERTITEVTGIGRQKLEALFDDVVKLNQVFYSELIDKAKVTLPDYIVSAKEIEAIKVQTLNEFTNLTLSMGFMLYVEGRQVLMPPGEAYQKALDKAAIEVESGVFSYEAAIKKAVKELSDSGIKTVKYDSGHIDHIDVAVRRAVMTGVSQICDKYTEQSAEYLGTDYFEVSAHMGARDVPGVSPWSSHKEWQGKVYSVRTGDKYPNIYAVCGLGEVDGLEGANCRHRRWAFVEGVSERTYTDEQLNNIDKPPFKYQGREYTTYQATQKQRQIERTVRRLKRQQAALKAAGLKEDEQAVSIRIQRLNQEYKAFSSAAGLPLQRERMQVYNNLETVNSPSTHEATAKMGSKTASVQTVGKIDVEKYNVVSDKIMTDEVIMTDERIKHIKERHPEDFERYSKYIQQIIESPDYILESAKANTAFILKEFIEANQRFQLILRLAVEGDNPEHKNSVITFLKVEKKRYERYLRTKKILYKSE